MEIYRDATDYIIVLSVADADDLKVACETPEYHQSILTKIAQELARLAKEPVAESYVLNGTALAIGSDEGRAEGQEVFVGIDTAYGQESAVVVHDGDAAVELTEKTPARKTTKK